MAKPGRSGLAQQLSYTRSPHRLHRAGMTVACTETDGHPVTAQMLLDRRVGPASRLEASLWGSLTVR